MKYISRLLSVLLCLALFATSTAFATSDAEPDGIPSVAPSADSSAVPSVAPSANTSESVKEDSSQPSGAETVSPSAATHEPNDANVSPEATSSEAPAQSEGSGSTESATQNVQPEQSLKFKESRRTMELREFDKDFDYQRAFPIEYTPASLEGEELYWQVKENCRQIANFVEYDAKTGDLADENTAEEDILVRFEVYQAGEAYIGVNLKRDATVFGYFVLTIVDNPAEPSAQTSQSDSLASAPLLGAPSGDPETIYPSITVTGETNLIVGSHHTYTAQASNFEANPTIVWSVANADGAADAHASIDEATGELTALSAGDILVTATAKDTEISGSICATVVPQAAVPSIAITGPSSLVAGDSHLYTAQASNFAANPTIVWSVANADGAADAHASIDEVTGELTALNAGDIIVTAAAQGTDVAANVNVSISAAAPLPSIAITGETNVTVGAVVSYSASASNFATAPTIHWSVSNADGATEPHATIDAEGNLSAVHAGSVVVTATAQDAEVSGNLAVTIVAATPTNTPEQLPDPQVIISGENTVAEGRAVQLSASVDQYPDAVFTWSVSSEDGVAHASVDQNGTVTGIKAGMAIITVSTILNEKNWSATFAVSVFAPYLTIVAPENASSLFVGSSLQFAAQAVGLEDGLAVTWSIANADGTESAYASVDENGLVTGLAEGKVSVRATVTANNNTYSDAYALDIVPVEITSAVISTPQAEIFSCNALQFSLSFLPENATYLPAAQDISWILDEGAASATINGGLLTPIVNEEGLLMGDDGQGGVTTVDAATVVVRGYYGEFYATANVTIRQAVTELFTEESLSVAMGRTEQIQFAVAPVGANQTITWSTSDSSIATVDECGSVTGVSAGDASITASIDGGRLTATTQVHVTQLAEDFDVFCPVSFLPIGDSCTVMTLFYPATSSDHLEWESSDPAVASINERGKITGHAAGSVSLRATNASGIVKTIELDVGVPADSILLFSDLFSFDYLVLGVGQVITLPVTLAPENATLASCISFDNDNGAYVITNGANSIKGVKKGRTSVTFISADGFASRTIQIRVVDKNRGVTKLSLNKSSINIQEGKTYSLRASVNSSASVKGVLWLSADANIAAVNGKGKVTAANPGTTTIYCLASSGILRSCSVTVKEVLPSSVKLNKSRLSIYAGKSYKLKATISPSNVLQEANRVLHWSTSNPMVALVTDEGQVFAMSPGTCTIKVTTANGKTRSCTVTVKAVRVSKVSASNPHGTLVTGGEYQMNCTLSPSNASNKEVTWKSSNNSVASVNSAGVVLAKSTGKATITATAKDGSGKRASFQVTVKAAPLEAFYVTYQNSETGEEISLEGTTLEMAYGQQIQVTPYVTPNISGVFTSSNDSVATVTKNGLITATGGGTATITAIAGGQYSLSFQVHVATDSTVAYRALVIGQFTSSKQKGYLTFCANSCTGIYDTLKRSRLDGNGYSIATGRNYSDPQSVLNKIASTFADADEDDVSIIYMNAHGESHDGSYRWYLYYGDDPNDASTYLTGGQIVNAVKQIKGHVVLFLASCYSGVCLTDPENAETFDTAEINALAEEAQSELMSASATVRSMISSADKSAAGSISVLCAATDTTGCYLKTASTRSIDFFTEAATRGMGWNLLDDVSCTPAADSNGDGIVTLGELAPYVRSETTSSTEYYQKLFPSAFMGNPSATSCYYVSSKAKNLAIVGGMNAQ